ncbi:DOMON-like domain-containing protein [Acaryochloris sp. IP29b_bin.137]|uniref:DOMON-like domain-containing protein n=1 Tax=Acaryochloris sp. IP29b_bin.137 TaxID=2969217 RepID=UPI0026174C7B|nr:DOMON-like domain-containing protein [Acaryochloris sp. IP29b_bin.137]
MTAFTLQPFAQPHPDVTITGTLDRQGNQLEIAYHLSGNLDQVILPASSDPPTRQYDLWEGTCFEFFLGLPQQPNYWEFNLSPTGSWNVFHLESYRHNLQEALAVNALPFQVQLGISSFTLSLTFDLASIEAVAYPLDVAICAVIQSPQTSLSYWALTHCGPQADFHQRDSFILQI